jgi:DNA-binding MarR family transcriptional regulator
MEDAGLVRRTRSSTDRRQVGTQLTERGRELVDTLDEAVAAEHRSTLGHMGEDRLRTLVDLLTLARRHE